MKRNYFFSGVILSVMLIVLAGCQKAESPRQYTEIVTMQGVPQAHHAESQEDVPANIDPNQMPDDEVHAAFKSPGSIATGEMPEDDIHAGLRNTPLAEGQPASSRMTIQAIDPEMAAMLTNSVVEVPLTWATPDGWIQQAASGMRLATFVVQDQENPIEVSIISLGGVSDVGSNTARWLAQVGLSISGTELFSFVDRLEMISTQTGQEGVLIDATALQGESALDSPSLVGAIIDNGGSQIFVKMTGSKKAVLSNKDNLKKLVQSISVNR